MALDAMMLMGTRSGPCKTSLNYVYGEVSWLLISLYEIDFSVDKNFASLHRGTLSKYLHLSNTVSVHRSYFVQKIVIYLCP